MKKLAIMAAAMALVLGLSQCKKNDENTVTPSKDGGGVITLPDGSGEKWAILLPQEALEAGASYSADVVYIGTRAEVPAIAENELVAAGIEVNVANDYADLDYVDLGLPSGLLWNTRNLGATTPEGFGNYYAWGETSPKDVYNPSTYVHCRVVGNKPKYTKYCYYNSWAGNMGYNGYTDDLTVLEPEDDAATANLGNGWRMPTQEEFQELLDNTSDTWATRNGVDGRLFTASNGNILFLPAAGYRYDSDLFHQDRGFYWSSSLQTDWIPWYAHVLYFKPDLDECIIHVCDREEGVPVRAVRSTVQN